MEKKIKGRKKHIMVDTLGLLLGCHVTTANISDNQGTKEFLSKFYLSCTQKVWADQAYAGVPLKLAYADQGIDLEIIKRSDTKFKILPKRWIVERTFSSMSRSWRLSKDYESLLQTTENKGNLFVCHIPSKKQKNIINESRLNLAERAS